MNISRVFESTLTLFNQKTIVTLIDAYTDNIITSIPLDKALLPVEFKKPTRIEINNKKWQVLKVKEEDKGTYFSKRKLTLYVAPADTFISQKKFLIPTKANIDNIAEYSMPPMFDEFTLSITSNDWLQLELLPGAYIDSIMTHLSEVESIISGPDDNYHLLGYETCYVRHLPNANLEIPIDSFCKNISIKKKGNIQLTDFRPIKDTFCIESENYIYYGVIKNKTIIKLAITKYDSFDDEIYSLISNHDLIFVDWTNGYLLR